MAEKTPFHQWTDEKGRVLIVKCLNKDGTSHNGFMWPKSGKVAIPKNSTKNDCESGGLFGWAWGIGVGDGKDPNACSPWLVFAAKPEHVIVVEDGPKVKACVSSEDAEVEVVYYGDMATAMYITSQQRVAWVMHNSDGKASATGEMGSASATGWSGSASATGESGSASATGWSGSASATGWSGSASATGWSGSGRGVVRVGLRPLVVEFVPFVDDRFGRHAFDHFAVRLRRVRRGQLEPVDGLLGSELHERRRVLLGERP